MRRSADWRSETGLSRGAIFHHFRDKESLFLAVAEDDAAAMVETVARNGLVQVMRDLLAPAESDVAGWLGTQLEVSRRLRTDPEFAKRWAVRSDAIAARHPGPAGPAARGRRAARRRGPSRCWPGSSSWPTTGWCCTWRWAARPAIWSRCSTWSKEAVRRS